MSDSSSSSGGGLSVELVAADRTVWSGQATMVVAKTVEGDLGVLAGHAPLLSLLAESVVEIQTGDQSVVVAVDGGFISVAGDRVSVLSERAELGDEIDAAEAQRELDDAQSAADGDDEEAEARVRRAEARVRAADRAS